VIGAHGWKSLQAPRAKYTLRRGMLWRAVYIEAVSLSVGRGGRAGWCCSGSGAGRGYPSVAGGGSRENLCSGSFHGPMYSLRQTRPRIHERKFVSYNDSREGTAAGCGRLSGSPEALASWLAGCSSCGRLRG
jgi:hypothetical protein